MSFRSHGSRHCLWLGGLTSLLIFALACPVQADPTGPRPSDRHVAFIVTTLLPREHLTRHPLDGEISQRMLQLFLKSLDPMKMYFMQSDIDGLMAHQNELVDKVRKGDISLAYKIFGLYLQRLDERVQMVDEILKVDPDFTLKETIVIDRDAARYSADLNDAREKWRKRIKYELLSLKVDKTEGQAAKDKLTRRYHSLSKRMHQTDAEELLEMYLNAMTSSFDPHTNYMSPSSVENFDIMMRLDLEGIGAALQLIDGYTVVQKIIPGGAADKDKRLKAEDKIVGVGQGAQGEVVDVVDMKLSDVVKMIRGKRGTVVRLEVISRDSPERKTYAITREKVELKDSEARAQVFQQGTKADGTPYKLGVIKLPSFYMDMNGAKQNLPDYRSTTRDVHKILDGFNRQGVDAVILDLRNNGGGSLTEAINLTGLFIGKGPVVQVKGSDGRVIPYDDQDGTIAWAGPLVVVSNKFSASASEILAGAIQDYRRGLIVGDHTTHGKGTVQSLLDLGQQLFRVPNTPSLGALKITVQQFYRPNGDSTQNRGVVSDVELPALTTHMDVGEADLEYSLAFDHVDPVRFRPANMVEQTMVGQLAARSTQRVSQSADFQKTQRKIARYLERKKQKKDTLNEKEFMDERAELNTDKEEEKLNNPDDGTAIERNYYLEEVMSITVDYLRSLGQQGQPANLAGPGQTVPGR